MYIGYIIKTKKNKFRTFVGTPIDSPGDNDSFIDVAASGPTLDTEEKAMAFLKENDQGIDKLYLKPIPAKSGPCTWLSELTKANP